MTRTFKHRCQFYKFPKFKMISILFWEPQNRRRFLIIVQANFLALVMVIFGTKSAVSVDKISPKYCFVGISIKCTTKTILSFPFIIFARILKIKKHWIELKWLLPPYWVLYEEWMDLYYSWRVCRSICMFQSKLN